MRIAAYNVENLFSRPVLFNMRDHDLAATYLQKIKEFTRLLQQESYRADKARIEALHEEIKAYIKINIRSSKVGRNIIEKGKLKAKGRDDWDGFVDLKRERFSEAAVSFTAKVIKAGKADVQCLVEVESAETLEMFNADLLDSMFSDRLVIDGNDPRGIDIGLGSRKDYPILSARTNIFARGDDGKKIFSRDCLEVEIRVKGGRSLFVLVNHFKAKDRTPVESDAKRRSQAVEVSRILKTRYDLSKDYVIVAGDLNDEPDSDPLAPLLATKGLENVWDVVDRPKDDRWTYYYGNQKAYNVIDYLLVSKALAKHITGAGIERRGMFDLAKLTGGAQSSFDGMESWKDAASDHALIWLDADI